MIYEHIKDFLRNHIKEILSYFFLAVLLTFIYLSYATETYESRISVIQEDYGVAELQGKENTAIGLSIFSNMSYTSRMSL